MHTCITATIWDFIIISDFRQVALADIILVNKTDLVTREQLVSVKKRVR